MAEKGDRSRAAGGKGGREEECHLANQRIRGSLLTEKEEDQRTDREPTKEELARLSLGVGFRTELPVQWTTNIYKSFLHSYIQGLLMIRSHLGAFMTSAGLKLRNRAVNNRL